MHDNQSVIRTARSLLFFVDKCGAVFYIALIVY